MTQVQHYTAEHIENPCRSGLVSPTDFHKVRNAIVTTCRKHGPTGPMGLFPVGRSFKRAGDFIEAWEPGDPDRAYYVIPDQYNEIDAYQYMEILKPEYFTTEWVQDIMVELANWPGWGIGITNVHNGYMLIFADKLMVSGTPFKAASDLSSVVSVAVKSFFR